MLGCCCRDLQVAAIFREKGVLLTTYGMIQHNAELLSKAPWPTEHEEEDRGGKLWDFLILDEVYCPQNSNSLVPASGLEQTSIRQTSGGKKSLQMQIYVPLQLQCSRHLWVIDVSFGAAAFLYI